MLWFTSGCRLIPFLSDYHSMMALLFVAGILRDDLLKLVARSSTLQFSAGSGDVIKFGSLVERVAPLVDIYRGDDCSEERSSYPRRSPRKKDRWEQDSGGEQSLSEA